MTVFTIDEVRKTFSNGEVKEEILKGVNLSLREGEITALVGASGSAKVHFLQSQLAFCLHQVEKYYLKRKI